MPMRMKMGISISTTISIPIPRSLTIKIFKCLSYPHSHLASLTSIENLQRKIGCSPPWFAYDYSLVCNKSLTREDVDILSTDVWRTIDASEFENCVRPCVRMEIESRILR